jgi:insertion element IS1 protein InsB
MPYWRPLVKKVKMVLILVLCPHCQSAHIMKGGKTKAGIQHYKRLFGHRKDEVFLKLKVVLEPFGITRYYTDYRSAYTHPLDADEPQPGKRNTQKIERKHLTLRPRIKRLVRKTICFSRSVKIYDIVIFLFVNRYEFSLRV